MNQYLKQYPIVKEYIPGVVYIRFSCGCVFTDSEDKKRKIRNTFEIKNGKRTYRVFCPNHKNNSYVLNRFKFCSLCYEKVVVTNSTKEGPCFKCKLSITRKKKREEIKPKKPKDCLQYGEKYLLGPKEELISEPLCKNRSYCLSFISLSNTFLQCNNCPHLNNDIFGD